MLVILLKILSDSLNSSISVGDNVSFKVHRQWIWIVIYGSNTSDWRNLGTRNSKEGLWRYPLEAGVGLDWNKFYDSVFILHYMCIFFKHYFLDIPSDAYLSGRLPSSQVSQMEKNLPAMQETFWSLSQEEPLEKGMAGHTSILA